MAGIPKGHAGGDNGLSGPRSFNDEIAAAHSASLDGMDDMLAFSLNILLSSPPRSEDEKVASAF
jgi:hypothetical protein